MPKNYTEACHIKLADKKYKGKKSKLKNQRERRIYNIKPCLN